MTDYKDPRVLTWINGMRKKDGRKPLKRIAYAKYGTDRDVLYPRTQNCPIARSLVDYNVNTILCHKLKSDQRDRNLISLPSYVSDWVSDFDANS